MSIHAAVAALGKEIEALDKKRARLVSLRDALVVEEGAEALPASGAPVKSKPGPKPGAKNKPGPKPGAKKATGKKATAKKAAVVPETAVPKKRVMSAEAKARIGAATKKRWAAKRAAEKKA